MEWRQKVLWQAATGAFVLLPGAPAGIGERSGGRASARGRALLVGDVRRQGGSLIRSGMPRGEDAVVLSMPDETERAAPALVVQLLDMAQARWRRLDGAHLLPPVQAGIGFVDGVQQEGKVDRMIAKTA
jgi:hypothetical protein